MYYLISTLDGIQQALKVLRELYNKLFFDWLNQVNDELHELVSPALNALRLNNSAVAEQLEAIETQLMSNSTEACTMINQNIAVGDIDTALVHIDTCIQAAKKARSSVLSQTPDGRIIDETEGAIIAFVQGYIFLYLTESHQFYTDLAEEINRLLYPPVPPIGLDNVIYTTDTND